MVLLTSAFCKGCLLLLACVAGSTLAQIPFGGGRRVPPTPTPPPTTRASSDLGSACRTPGGRPGRCDRLFECPSLVELMRARNIAYLRQSMCGKAGAQTLLCCPDGVPALRTHPPPPPSPSPSPSSSPPSAPEDACGVNSLNEPLRLIGGVRVKALGTFPWMAALQYSQGEQFQCGAAIVGRRWLLTAAHCVNIPGGPVSARVGDLNLATVIDDDEQHPPQTLRVERAIRHPQYVRRLREHANDIALIKLENDIHLSEVVRPICLPARPSPGPLSGGAVIAGWGITTFNGLGSVSMQYDGINITSITRCRSSYQLSPLRISVDVERQVCASGNLTARGRHHDGCDPADDSVRCQGGVDACKGDSGGPLMTYRRLAGDAVQFTAVGVMSFALGCGEARYPGIYTRVDAYLDWISRTMAAECDC